ncbi:hypothetical protein B0J14DRAFT_266785 [Halenospora varia]|nr:hypothetical protein B0J14DRAFT_266785 [Halenospora varia]
MIWREAFPPARHVDLTGLCRWRIRPKSLDRIPQEQTYDHGRRCRELDLLKRHFPIILSINKESRQETLTSYFIVRPWEPFSTNSDEKLCGLTALCRRVPIWFNPIRDTAYFSHFDLFMSADKRAHNFYISHGACILRKIVTLEFGDHSFPDYGSIVSLGLDPASQSFVRFLGLLPALKTLAFPQRVAKFTLAKQPIGWSSSSFRRPFMIGIGI